MNPANDEPGARIDHWLVELNHPDWNIRATAARNLGEFDEQAPLEPLLAALHDEDESVRAAAVRALGKLGKRAPVDCLVGALSDSSWMVREMAALTLGELGERAPAAPLVDLLRTEQEDVVVREAAQIALQQAHPEVALSPEQHALSIGQAQDISPSAADRHPPMKSPPAWFISLAQGLSGRHSAMGQGGNLVEQAELPTAANASLPPPSPAMGSSVRSLPGRIAVGVLVSLLLLSGGLSWLWLTHKPLQSSHAGSTSVARSTFTPTGGAAL